MVSGEVLSRWRRRIQKMAESHPRLLQQLEAHDLVTIDYMTIARDGFDDIEEFSWESD